MFSMNFRGFEDSTPSCCSPNGKPLDPALLHPDCRPIYIYNDDRSSFFFFVIIIIIIVISIIITITITIILKTLPALSSSTQQPKMPCWPEQLFRVKLSNCTNMHIPELQSLVFHLVVFFCSISRDQPYSRIQFTNSSLLKPLSEQSQLWICGKILLSPRNVQPCHQNVPFLC